MLTVLLIASTAVADLPRVLMLGDPVYNEPSRSAAAMMKGRVELVYPGYAHNEVIDTTTALTKLDEWIGDKSWDLIHFNFGLGDLIHRVPSMKQLRVLPIHVGGTVNTPPDRYEQNLDAIVQRLKATDAKLVWASTTPIRSSSSNVFEIGSEITYNAIAAKVMAKHGVATNDMHAHVKTLIDMTKPGGFGSDPFNFDKKPLHPKIVRTVLTELDLLRPLKQPVKVFVMSGDSAHVGGGTVIDANKPRQAQPKGSLDELVLNPATATQYAHLLREDGSWAMRPDVWVQYDRRGHKSGALGIGYGGDRKRGIGPELSLGHVLGDHFEQQVFVLKTDLGDPALATDLRPPSSGESGKQYPRLIEQIEQALTSMRDKFPDYSDAVGYELSGLIVNIGQKDDKPELYQEYLPLLIQDLRKDLKAPKLPVVIVGTGLGGHAEPKCPDIIKIQKAVATRTDAVTYVETRDFWPPEDARDSYRHAKYEYWYNNALSFLQMGEAIGKSLIQR